VGDERDLTKTDHGRITRATVGAAEQVAFGGPAPNRPSSTA
jgi:hypothetical protein